MRLIDADKLYPDSMTNKGTVAISQSQIAQAPTVEVVPLSFLKVIKKEIDEQSQIRPDGEFYIKNIDITRILDKVIENHTECCRSCVYCQYIKSPSITGNPIDYVCQLKGATIENIDIKNCDGMFEARLKDAAGSREGRKEV